MSEASASLLSPSLRRGRFDWPVAGAVVALGATLLAVNLLSGGSIVAVVSVLLGIGALVLVWFIPMRWTLNVALLLGLTMEAPNEAFAEYLFRSPLEPLGRLLLGNLNLTTHVAAMKFTGFDCLMVYLIVLQLYRRLSGITIDTKGSTPIPKPFVLTIGLSIATSTLLLGYGVATGGDMVKGLVQARNLVYTGVFCLVLHGAYRGVADLRTLGRILVGAAVYRALFAVWIYKNVFDRDGQPVACSTTHADSVLFVGALALLIVLGNERAKGSAHWTRFVAAACILAGMVYNHRRLVWVSLVGSLLIVALISPWTPLKRWIARIGLLSLPLLAIYVAVGWNMQYSTVFRPVATLRSVVDAKSDGSTKWRDLENGSLAQNISDHPFVGTGFGHEYVEYWQFPSVADAYPLYLTVPHNSLVAYFVFAGPAGIAGIFGMFVATVFLAARAYHRSADPMVRSAAMLCIVFIFQFLNIMYGDIGVIYWLSVFTLGPSMMIAGKLAVATGAWPHKNVPLGAGPSGPSREPVAGWSAS